jgi:phosphate ABC transporter phosphate-binding protein
MYRRFTRALIALVAVAYCTSPLIAAHADGPTVNGAGSTWVQNALDQWRADVQRQGININYQGVGSSAGRQLYIQRQVDFAASEIPFQPDEVSSLQQDNNHGYIYFPDVAGGTSFMYNLRDASGARITDLRLKPSTLAKIFTRDIKDWSDPAITADNNGRRLPSQAITPVVRSDGSGTSAQFTLFLMKTEGDIFCPWEASLGITPCSFQSFWPQNASGYEFQNGSDGVANFVANDSTGAGAITYVETSYALQRGFPVAAIQNKSGNYTVPTAANVAIALTKATLNADHTQNLDAVYTNPDPHTYPVSSYSYMIAPTDTNHGFTPDKGQVFGKFILYAACTGQRKANELGYSPLPKNLVQVVFDAEQHIPGAPKPPAISKCDNPTIQGGFGSIDNSTGGKLSSGGKGGGVIPPGSPPGGGAGGGSGGAGGDGSSGAGSPGAGGSLGAAGGTAGSGGSYTGGPANGSSGGGSLYAGGDGRYAGGGPNGSDEALPAERVRSKAPSWLPLAAAALILLALIFIPPLYAITGATGKERD